MKKKRENPDKPYLVNGKPFLWHETLIIIDFDDFFVCTFINGEVYIVSRIEHKIIMENGIPERINKLIVLHEGVNVLDWK